MKEQRILRTSILVVVFIVLGKIIAFSKDVVISSFFGAGLETDAFFIAANITASIFLSFYLTITIIFLPLYNEIRIKHGQSDANFYSNNMINLYLVVSAAITFVGFLGAPKIVSLVNYSVDKESVYLSIKLLQIMVFSFVITTFVGFMTAIQLSHEKYLYPHLIPILNNTIVVVAIVIFSPYYGIFVPALAGVIGWLIQAPFHWWIVRKYFHYSFHFNLRNEEMKKAGVLFAPAFLGILVDQANVMVDTTLASGLLSGSVSAVNYANRLVSFSGGVFIMAVLTIAYPLFTKSMANGDVANLSREINKSLRILVLVITPVVMITALYSEEIVSMVFERGKFGGQAVDLTASVFFFYSLGLMFLAFRELLNKVFYAQKNTKTPLLISCVSVAVNISLSIAFVDTLGVKGLALASSISLMLYVCIQLTVLHRSIGKSFYSGIQFFLGKLSLAIGFAMLTMVGWKNFVFFDVIYLNVISGATVGVMFFILILFLLKNEELLFIKKKYLR